MQIISRDREKSLVLLPQETFYGFLLESRVWLVCFGMMLSMTSEYCLHNFLNLGF